MNNRRDFQHFQPRTLNREPPDPPYILLARDELEG